jgi:hypothetical protein
MNLLEISEFWAHVDIRGLDECWPWRGQAVGYGHHYFRSEKRSIAAHRAAYEITKGVIKKGYLVIHSCDNPPCCNPQHLRQGTAKDNSMDCVERGRSTRGAIAAIEAAVGEPPKSLNERAAFVALRQGLLPVAIVAGRAGISLATAWRWAKKAGGPQKTRKQREDELWQRAIDEAKKEP